MVMFRLNTYLRLEKDGLDLDLFNCFTNLNQSALLLNPSSINVFSTVAEDEHVSPWWIMLPYWSPHFGYLQISLVTTVGIRRRNVGLLPPCSEDRDLLCIKCYNKYFRLEISSLKCCTLILERNAFSFCLSLNILNEFDFVLPVTVFKYRSACFLKAATLPG